MSLLQTISKPKTEAPIITIVGFPGTGKTTLGGLFPNPIFIAAETGAATFDGWEEKPDFFPTVEGKATPTEYVSSLVIALGKEEHNYKTLVVDSVTALNLLFEKQLMTKYNETAVMNCAGGYGKGLEELATMHRDFFMLCKHLAKVKNMAIVFLAHTGMEKIKDSPSETADYSVYSLDMPKKSASVYVANSDAVLYLTKEKFITGSEVNKKGQTTKYGKVTETGNRILVTNSDGRTGFTSAKNRYGLETEIQVPHGTNPLLTQINFFKQA